MAQRDEVDRILEDWHRVRPELDVSAFSILSRVSRLSRHLDRARRAVFQDHGLEPFEFDVLVALRRAGDPFQLSPGQLLTQTLVTSGTMTNRIDKMVQHDLVDRLPDPSDKRSVFVRLTSLGKEKADAALEDLLHRERAILEPLAGGDYEKLASLLRELLVQFENNESAE